MQAFQQDEQMLSRLLAATPDAIIVVNADGRIVLVNDQASTLFGYSQQEFMQIDVEQLLPERFRNHHAAHRHAYRQMPAVRPMGGGSLALFGLRKDGSEFPAEISLSPLNAPEGFLAITAVRDVTQQKENEASLRRAKDTAEAANRELEAFSYSVAHDLRAPLRSIDGFSQALLEDYTDRLDDDGKDYLHRIRGAAQRMARLIDDLLALSRVTRTELHLDRVNLTVLSQEIMGRLLRSNPTRHVEFVVQEGLRVDADRRLMRIVLENLLGNAFKFTAKKAEATIEVGLVPDSTSTTYFIRDNGAGFDMSYRDKLFGVFQRLHQQSEFEGTGIGLATVQRIIHRHGGQVWADGAIDQGATFFFTLPSGGAK